MPAPTASCPASVCICLHLQPACARTFARICVYACICVMSAPPPALDPANVQWLLHYGRRSILPRCVNSTNIKTMTFPDNLGDILYASNRCMPRAWIDNRTATSYAYLSVVPAAGRIYLSDCGRNSSCRAGCTVAAQFSTHTLDPCTASFFTGAYSNSDYLSTDLWDPNFNTPYFAYITRSFGDSTCANVSLAIRNPIYQNCTKMPDGSYSVYSNTETPGLVFWSRSSDANCSTNTGGISRFTINTRCSSSQSSGLLVGGYEQGPLLNVPSLNLSARMPASRPRPLPPPSYPSGYSPPIGLMVGLVVGPLLLSVVIFTIRKFSSLGAQSAFNFQQSNFGPMVIDTLPRYTQQGSTSETEPPPPARPSPPPYAMDADSIPAASYELSDVRRQQQPASPALDGEPPSYGMLYSSEDGTVAEPPASPTGSTDNILRPAGDRKSANG
ncbi:uncharacterized protein BJ171DRAFT_510185 [Polychytrium aggregatum]|uniref:uncharacterized protein n=1 Tax=Polychytrium aggregatum TaxID=110093 RepID=UPI0022FEB303|nr:uncharacterized protein BJ171DRAFT_510185 [Polychytrium aggregatum]KAI9203270.1 hypothetical protein BJ171DRAFT_510185 [Polychytrium aggregatum]